MEVIEIGIEYYELATDAKCTRCKSRFRYWPADICYPISYTGIQNTIRGGFVECPVCEQKLNLHNDDYLFMESTSPPMVATPLNVGYYSSIPYCDCAITEYDTGGNCILCGRLPEPAPPTTTVSNT